jgi:hypothetical protein
MVGGPHDGWALPYVGENPPLGEYFGDIPYRRECTITSPFFSRDILPQGFPHVAYRLEMFFKDQYKNIAIYGYTGPSCRLEHV